MSQNPFMWNYNNPFDYEDPTGYSATVWDYGTPLADGLTDLLAVAARVAIGAAGVVLMAGSPIRAGNGEDEEVPQRAYETRDFIRDHNGSPPPNRRGGRPFRDDDKKLSAGHHYTEYDVNARQPGQPRDSERLVRDDTTGQWYYTDDYYSTFHPLSDQTPEFDSNNNSSSDKGRSAASSSNVDFVKY